MMMTMMVMMFFSNHDADEYEYVTVLLTYDRIS
jgi:hypothetical protein